MKRPSIDEYYLGIAKAVSMRSTCIRKHYGAVIVKNGEIVSTGYNNPPRGEPHCWTCTKCDHGKDASTYIDCPAVHAEMNAIISASRNEMLGSTMYLAGYEADTGYENLNVEPCEICLRLIKNAGIDAVITSNGIIYKRNPETKILEKRA
jgi:dCMP deaminase